MTLADTQSGIRRGSAAVYMQDTHPEIEEFLGRKVHLFLQVKVRENWLDEAERYSEMGLDFKDGNA